MTLSFAHHPQTSDNHKIGVISATLLSLLEAGFPVPKGFVISPQTVDAFLTEEHLGTKILQLIERCNFHDLADVRRVSQAIKKLILASAIPEDIAADLIRMSLQFGNERVILTASPISELEESQADLRARRSLFGVKGEANILIAVRELWCTLFDPENLYFIHTQKQELPRMSICIQHQPHALVTGTMRTTDQTKHDKRLARIQAVWGEGGYVGKLGEADTYWLEKDTLREQEVSTKEQSTAIHLIDNQMEEVEVPAMQTTKRKLPSAATKELARLAKRLQQHTFFPQDVIWAYDGNHLYLVATAPVSLEEAKSFITTSQPSTSHRKVLLKGISVSPGIITGKVRIIAHKAQSITCKPGDIAVVHSFGDLDPQAYKHIRGLIVEEDAPDNDGIFQATQNGVATLIGAADATNLLQPESYITLHSPSGEVLAGTAPTFSVNQVSKPRVVTSATKVGVNLNLEAQPHSLEHVTGHILVSAKRFLTEQGIHPLQLQSLRRVTPTAREIAHRLQRLQESHPENHIILTLADFTSAEYRHLQGGETLEMSDEPNPLLGYHGSARLLDRPQLIAPEIEGLRLARNTSSHKGLSLLLPGVRTAYEVARWHKVLSTFQLERSAALRLFVDASIPALLWQIEETLGYGIDGLYIDLDRLATSLFLLEANNSGVHLDPSDVIPTMLKVLNIALKKCQEEGVRVILAGKMVLEDDLLTLAVNHGVSEVVVHYSALAQVEERLMAIESQRIKNHV